MNVQLIKCEVGAAGGKPTEDEASGGGEESFPPMPDSFLLAECGDYDKAYARWKVIFSFFSVRLSVLEERWGWGAIAAETFNGMKNTLLFEDGGRVPPMVEERARIMCCGFKAGGGGATSAEQRRFAVVDASPGVVWGACVRSVRAVRSWLS